MSRIDMPSPNRTILTQFEKAKAHDNQPMKRSRDISRIFKFLSKLLIESGETLSQREKMNETFVQVMTWQSM